MRGPGSNRNRRSAAKSAGRVCPVDQCRATVSFSISAMALAGLRPYQKVSVQFMMVWQW